VCPGLKSAGIKAPVGRPDDTPKQVGFGILIHPEKPPGFLGLAPKGGVGWKVPRVCQPTVIASRIDAEQILNEAAMSRASRALYSIRGVFCDPNSVAELQSLRSLQRSRALDERRRYLILRTVGLRSNWAKPL
jgi:hypothetical protein